jgi:hypothetical protein
MENVRMSFVTLLIFCFCGSVSLFSQVKFFKQFGNNGYDAGKSIVQLKDSSFMVAGSSSSFVEAPSQAFMLKISKTGQYEWSKHFGGDESDNAQRIVSWNDTVFFLIGTTSSYNSVGFDAWLVKTDQYGNELLNYTYPKVGWERINDVFFTEDSLLIMVGESITSSNNTDMYLLCVDHNGDVQWTFTYGTTGFDRLNSIHEVGANTFGVVGTIYDEVEDRQKAIMILLNKEGGILEERYYGENYDFEFFDFYSDPSGFFALGASKSAEDNWLAYVARMDNTGSLQSEEFGGGSTVILKGVCMYDNGNSLYVTSEYQNEISTNFTMDVSVNKYSLGLFWANSYVNVNFNGMDRFSQIRPTSDGGAVVVGSSERTDLGGSAVYVMKIGANDDYPLVTLFDVQTLVHLNEIDAENKFRVGPNPTTGHLKIFSSDKHYGKVTVNDLYGKQLLQGFFDSDTEIDLQDLGNGTYLITFQEDGKQPLTKRITVQK